MTDKSPPLWPDRQPNFHCLLGRLVTTFADVERGIRAMIGNYANLPDWKTRAIFGGESAQDIMRHVRALIAGQPTPSPNSDLVDYVFNQIRIISDARHSLIHEGPIAVPKSFDDPSEIVYQTDNLYRAKKASDFTVKQFTLDEVVQMIHDCRTIAQLLEFIRTNGLTSPQEIRIRAQNLSSDAWLYKHSPTSRSNRERRKALP